MKDDYTFAIACWSLVLGPLVIALITWNFYWLWLYVAVALIFGMAG